MPGLTDSLRILITANGAQAEREFSRVGAASRRSLGQAEDSATRYSRTLTSAGVAMATFGAVALVGLGKAAQAAEEENLAHIKLQNTLKNVPELAGASADAFYDQASALQDVTQFADDTTVAAQAMLGQFGLTQDQLMQLIPLVQDYAAKTGTDLVTAARNVGKATAGTNTTLKRAGVQFDEAAYSADHFAGTMQALQGYAGGFAQEQGKTLSGQLAILKNNFNDIAEAIGGGAASAFSDILAPVGALADLLDSLDPSTQALVGRLLTFGAVGVTAAGGLLFVAGQALRLKGVLVALSDTVLATRVQMLYLAASETAVGAAAITALGAIAPYVAALAAGYVVLHDYIEATGEWSASTDQAAAATSTFTNVLSNNGSVLDAVATNVNAAIDAHSKLESVLQMSGTSANDFAEIVTRTAPNNLGGKISEIAMAVQRAGGSYEEAQGALTDFALAQNDAARAMIAAAVSAGRIDPVMSHNAIGAASAGQATRDYIGALRILEGQDPGAFDGIAASADTAADAVDQLSQSIKDYLSQTFDVPDAQRALQQAFAEVQETVQGLAFGQGSWYDLAEAQEGVVRSTADLIDKQNQQGAGQAQLDATVRSSIATLRNMRDQGIITGHQFDVMSGQIRAVPHESVTNVSAPGADDTINKLRTVRTTIDGIPRDIVVRVSVPNLGAIAADVAGAAAALRGLRAAETISPSRRAGGGGSGGGRIAGGVIGTTTTAAPGVTVNIHGTASAEDGQAVVDALQRWQRRNGPVPVRVG